MECAVICGEGARCPAAMQPASVVVGDGDGDGDRQPQSPNVQRGRIQARESAE